MRLSDTKIDFDEAKQALLESLRSDSRFTGILDQETISVLVNLIAGVSSYMAYKIHSNVMNAYLPTAFSKTGIWALALSSGGEPPHRKRASKLVCRFTPITTAGATIPPFSIWNRNGIEWYNREEVVVNEETEPQDVVLHQGTVILEENIQANNVPYFTHLIGEAFDVDDPISSNEQSIIVEVSSTPWDEEKFSFITLGEVLPGSGHDRWFQRTTPEGGVSINFGNGDIGNTPDNVSITYASTLGAAGNSSIIGDSVSLVETRSAGTITDGDGTVLNVVATVVVAASGGEDEETTERIKITSPRLTAANRRAVRRDDYIAHLLGQSNVAFANAWGEAIESKERGDEISVKNANVVHISLAKNSVSHFYHEITPILLDSRVTSNEVDGGSGTFGVVESRPELFDENVDDSYQNLKTEAGDMDEVAVVNGSLEVDIETKFRVLYRRTTDNLSDSTTSDYAAEAERNPNHADFDFSKWSEIPANAEGDLYSIMAHVDLNGNVISWPTYAVAYTGRYPSGTLRDMELDETNSAFTLDISNDLSLPEATQAVILSAVDDSDDTNNFDATLTVGVKVALSDAMTITTPTTADGDSYWLVSSTNEITDGSVTSNAISGSYILYDASEGTVTLHAAVDSTNGFGLAEDDEATLKGYLGETPFAHYRKNDVSQDMVNCYFDEDEFVLEFVGNLSLTDGTVRVYDTRIEDDLEESDFDSFQFDLTSSDSTISGAKITYAPNTPPPNPFSNSANTLITFNYVKWTNPALAKEPFIVKGRIVLDDRDSLGLISHPSTGSLVEYDEIDTDTTEDGVEVFGNKDWDGEITEEEGASAFFFLNAGDYFRFHSIGDESMEGRQYPQRISVWDSITLSRSGTEYTSDEIPEDTSGVYAIFHGAGRVDLDTSNASVIVGSGVTSGSLASRVMTITFSSTSDHGGNFKLGILRERDVFQYEPGFGSYGQWIKSTGNEAIVEITRSYGLSGVSFSKIQYMTGEQAIGSVETSDNQYEVITRLDARKATNFSMDLSKIYLPTDSMKLCPVDLERARVRYIGRNFLSEDFDQVIENMNGVKNFTSTLRLRHPSSIITDVEVVVHYSQLANRERLRTRIEKSIRDFFKNRLFSLGSFLAVSDIYNIVTSVDGVDFCEVLVPSRNVQVRNHQYLSVRDVRISFVASARENLGGSL